MKLIGWDEGQVKVFVYRNLRRRCWSAKQIGGLNNGRVILHARTISLFGAHFSVSKTGRERVLVERQKNVHAGVVGFLNLATVLEQRYTMTEDTLMNVEVDDSLNYITHNPEAIEVTYNPYKFEEFVDVATESPVREKFLNVILDHDMRVWSTDNSIEEEVA